MAKRLDINGFIEQAKKVHGDKYDYSKVEYINNHTNVTIGCPVHGYINITPQNHLRGCGCGKCSVLLKKQNKPLSNDEFIYKAKKVHGDKYDYSKVEYVDAHTDIIIGCPVHGDFKQKSGEHLRGRGCKKCGWKQDDTSSFITKAMLVHGNRYDYSKVEYKNSSTSVSIICPKHGEFWQKPNDHLNGHGCPICNESKLEKEIEKHLMATNIKFEKQKKFEWLGRLTIDFYLPDYNVGIECQGGQHFLETSWFNHDNFHDRIERDKRKRKLCEENGVNIFYFSNLNIDYPYIVYEDKNNMLKKIVDGKKV